MKQFLFALMILAATTTLANAQVTVAGSVDSSTSANGDHHYSETRDAVHQDENGAVVTHEAIAQDKTSSEAEDGDTIKEVIPTGAVKSKDIKRTETGRIVIDKD